MYVFTGLFIKSLEEIENKKVSINIKNEDIKLDNLQSLINDKEKIKTYKYKDLSDDEWKEYFKRIKSTLISQVQQYNPIQKPLFHLTLFGI